jgi:hypothetical protein
MDALIVINDLSRQSLAEGEQVSPGSQRHYTDVNGDNRVTAVDALQVINYLTQIHRGAVGSESELVLQPAATDTPDVATGNADAVFAGLADDGEEKITSDAVLTTQAAVGIVRMMDPISRTEADQDDDEEVLDLLADDLLYLQS